MMGLVIFFTSLLVAILILVIYLFYIIIKWGENQPIKVIIKKTELIPFNIKKAKAGANVVTREGRPVSIETYDGMMNNDYPILGWVTVNDMKLLYSFSKDGKAYMGFGKDCELDLFIKELV